MIDENELEEVWLAEVALDEGKALSASQQSLLSKFKNVTKLNPGLPLKGMMSWGHCLAGSPFSMSAQVLKMNGLKMNAIGMNAGGLENGLAALNTQEKDQLAAELAQLTRITVNEEVWYVPADYLDEPGCYWDEAQDCVVGPCGIPLSQDSLARTEAEFDTLMKYLVKQDFANDPELDVEQKISAIHLYDLLENKLCKSSIGIDGWINNNIAVTETDDLGEKLRALHEQMESNSNPLLYLYTTVRDLIVDNQKEEIDEYIKECEDFVSSREEVTIFDQSTIQDDSGKAFLFPTPTNSFQQAV